MHDVTEAFASVVLYELYCTAVISSQVIHHSLF